MRSDVKTYFAVGRDGTLAYVPASTVRNKLVWVDRNGKSSSIMDDPRPFSHPRLSPDGTKVVLANAGIWVHELKTAAGARLAPVGSRPLWTADGRHILFASAVPKPGLYSVPADGSSESQLVLAQQAPAVGIFPLAWSADGQLLAYSNPTGETSRDVWVMPRDGKPAPFLNTTLDERAAMFSPDGHWMVYAVKDTGREEEVYVQPYPGPGGRWLISAGGGTEPVWSRDGKEIFYRTLDGSKMMSVAVQTRTVFSASAPKLLFHGSYARSPGTYFSNYDVSPDSQRFIMLEPEKSAADTQVNVVLNWAEELKRRLSIQ
jgi:Tol biopolymer transport system component